MKINEIQKPYYNRNNAVSNENYQIKFENLFKLYEKRCLDYENLQLEMSQKENQIIDLNLVIKSLNEQLFKLKKNDLSLKNTRQLNPEDYLYAEHFNVLENEITIKKNKQIDDLKYEALKFKQKYSNLESKLEKYYKIQIETEKKKNKEEIDLKIKQIIVEKESKYQEAEKEIKNLKKTIQGFEDSYISMKDHEMFVNKFKERIREFEENYISMKDHEKILSSHKIKIEESQKENDLLKSKKSSKRSYIDVNSIMTIEDIKMEKSDADQQSLDDKSKLIKAFDSCLASNKSEANRYLLRAFDSNLASTKHNNKIEEDEQPILEESKINDVSNINVNLNIKKYL